MSAALPYLNKLRKSDLVDFAEITGLNGYEDYNKSDLIVALDIHLVANRSTFVGNGRLADYYKRLAQPARFATPAKRAKRVEVPSSSPAEVLTRSSRRQRAVQPQPVVKKEEKESESGQEQEQEETKSERSVAATDVSEAATLQDNTAIPPETPKVPTPKVPTTVELPPSPAVVTDAIDRQTAAWGKSINETWTSSGVIERSNALRTLLSSVKAIETLVLLLEGSGIIRQIWPLRYLTTVPAIKAINTPEFALNVPDFFILLDGAFWAPFSLWLLTSVFLPLGTAYFFNIKATSTDTTRNSNSQRTNFDPLSFNIARALIAYLVYAKHFSFWDLYSGFTIEKVNASVPGEWSGMLTGTAIGLVGTLYEAILQK
ncbi:uncharacterized protein ASPGLDRAFT_28748 [Aspergillus glaucus CBS 516.65]|uniref:Rho termination factor N-terminal domain-containing protein n=1 Tax=Aspergillus glaucus CBS 516.65 TaxID=1160497 RepID=A0A1L9V9X5_ASPGL|nr:hypothetical protein ASPGLDRAFT_28748 [Aspergillus glaucus CBS 516.65]OJJ80724.1 hypothetical protein ASPGLDRAFT_28748 [Aspergillus glaucus CBS 516.65]